MSTTPRPLFDFSAKFIKCSATTSCLVQEFVEVQECVREVSLYFHSELGHLDKDLVEEVLPQV